MKYRFTSKAFTLAELLIALAILGVIATFTIPKIIDSGSSSKSQAIVLETASTIAAAYQNLKLTNGASASTNAGDLTAYMNYVNVDTVSLIDNTNDSGTSSTACQTSECIRLHNGALLSYSSGLSFNGTFNTNCLSYIVDPDGKYTTTEGAINLMIYYNGRVVSRAHALPNSGHSSTASFGSAPDANWFSWSN